MILPDYLNLTDAQKKEERKRQENLRRDFNSRARLTPSEIERARALILENDLRTALKNCADKAQKKLIRNQLAENLSQQGRFIEAAKTVSDREAKKFYRKAAASFDNKPCDCAAPVEAIGNRRIQLPKTRVIKEIYSLAAHSPGYLLECVMCQNAYFSTTAPAQTELTDMSATNDLERLKI